MKKILTIALFAGCGLCFAHQSRAQEFKEHIKKEFAVSGNRPVLSIYNVFGNLKVEGYKGSQILIDIDETIIADEKELLESAKSEFRLGFDQKGDSISAYTAEPYDSRPHIRQSDDRNDHNRHYHVLLEYSVKVPVNTNLVLSTINDGTIDVNDVHGYLKINNINGPVQITKAKGAIDAHTINGDMSVSYLEVPLEASSYFTLNGKLEVTYPKDFSANLQLKSLNGQFFTDFSDAEEIAPGMMVTKEKKGNSTLYRLNKDTRIKIGSGGKLFRFETLNGNIYIKKQI